MASKGKQTRAKMQTTTNALPALSDKFSTSFKFSMSTSSNCNAFIFHSHTKQTSTESKIVKRRANKDIVDVDLLPTLETTSTPPLTLSDATKNIQFWSTPSFNNYIQYKRYVNDYMDDDRAPDIAAIKEHLKHYTDDNADVLNIDTEYMTTMDYIRLASSGRSGWLTDRVINAYATHGIMARNAYINKQCIFPAKPTKNWLILNSYHLHTILCDGDKDPSIKGKYNAAQDNEHLLKKENFNDYIGLLIPYNHNGNHWILIKVDFCVA